MLSQQLVTTLTCQMIDWRMTVKIFITDRGNKAVHVLSVTDHYHSQLLSVTGHYHSQLLSVTGHYHSQLLSVTDHYHSQLLSVTGHYHSQLLSVTSHYHFLLLSSDQIKNYLWRIAVDLNRQLLFVGQYENVVEVFKLARGEE